MTLDRTHPLAAGLEFCAVAGEDLDDLVGGYKGTRTSNVQWRQTLYGRGRYTTANNQHISWSGVPDEKFTGAITVMWVGVLHVYNSTDGGYLFSKNPSGSTNANKPSHLYVAAGPAMRWLRGNSAGGILFSQWGNLTLNQPYVAIVSATDAMNDTPEWFVNGVRSAPTPLGTTTGSAAGNGGVVFVNGDATTGGATGNGSVTTNIAAIWSRKLSLAEKTELWRDPYCFLKV